MLLTGCVSSLSAQQSFWKEDFSAGKLPDGWMIVDSTKSAKCEWIVTDQPYPCLLYTSIVAHGVNQLRTPENAAIVITHYQRLLDYIKPDVVHVLYKGRIVKTAGPELALELEEKGYD